MRSRWSSVVTLAVVAITASLIVWRGPAVLARLRADTGLGGRAFAAAIVPGANVLLVSDEVAIRKTGFGRRMRELGEAQQADPAATMPMGMAVDPQRIEALTGLGDEDFVATQLTVGLEALNLDTAPDLDRLELVAAIALAKPLEAEAMKAAADELLRGAMLPAATQLSAEHGATLLTATVQGGVAADQPRLAVALLPGGRTVYLGFEHSVRAALERLREGTPAEMSPELAAARDAVPAGSQAWAAAVLPQTVRSMMTSSLEGEPTDDTMAVVARQAFTELRHMVVATRFGEADAEASLSLQLVTPELARKAAAYLQTALDTHLAPATKQIPADQRPPVLDSIAVVSEGAVVRGSARLTEGDLTKLQDLAAAAMAPLAGMGAPAPRGIPGATHQMPGARPL